MRGEGEWGRGEEGCVCVKGGGGEEGGEKSVWGMGGEEGGGIGRK